MPREAAHEAGGQAPGQPPAQPPVLIPTPIAAPIAAPRSEASGMSYLFGMLDGEMNRRATSPVLIGRATEMAALDAALDTVSQGSPAALLIGGEAGVGKSRLLSEFALHAQAS